MKPGPWMVVLMTLIPSAASAQQPAPDKPPAMPAAPAAAPAAAAPDIMALGRQNATWFNAGELEPLWQTFSDSMKKKMDLEKLKAVRSQIESQLGKESALLEEKIAPDPKGRQAYTRKAKFSNVDMPILVQWTFDESGKADGFVIHPE